MRLFLLGITLAIIGVAIFTLQSGKVTPSSGGAVTGNGLPEITNPSGFINTRSASSGQAGPITLAELVGKKVILVDFWTYSCINCQRTFPYVNAWYEKYKDNGLEIVSIHTPEFDFEKQLGNVQTAVDKYGIKYPVVLDNDYGTWTAFQNSYWPRKYLIDINGKIVYDHIGEGAYDETERKIQELLKERMTKLGEAGTLESDIAKPANVIVVSGKVQSPEIYFGAGRNEYLVNGKAGAIGAQTFTAPTKAPLNGLILSGTWNITPESATASDAGAKIIYRYSSKDVYFVAGSKEGATVRVTRDGKPLGAAKGEDVGADGTVVIKGERLYKLIQDSSYGEHVLEIELLKGTLEAFTFTFG